MSLNRTVRRAVQILAFNLGLCSACAGPAPTPVASTPPPAAPAPRAAPADASLTTQEYVQLGVPDPARPWTGAELGQAVRALTQLAQQRPDALPRHQSPRSGVLFARLTTTPDLSSLGDQDATLEQRGRTAEAFLAAASPMFGLYEAALARGAVDNRDAIEVVGWQYRCLAAVLGFAAEAGPQLDPEDPEHAARLKAFDAARADAGSAVKFTVDAMRASSTSADERRTLLGQLQETFPTILPTLTASAQSELLTSLRQLDADPAQADLDPDLGFLIDESQRAAAASSLPPTS